MAVTESTFFYLYLRAVQASLHAYRYKLCKLPSGERSSTTLLEASDVMPRIQPNNMWSTALLCLLGMLAGCETNPNEELARQHLSQGKLLLARGEVATSINEFQAAVQLTPASSDAHSHLAMALGAKGDISGAVTEYRTAVNLHPDSETLQQVGILLASSGDLEGGILAFRSALELQPADARVHYNLGMALKDRGHIDEALEEFRQTLRYKSTDYEARYQLGLTLKEKGLREDALQELQAVLRQTPDKPVNARFLALVRKNIESLE